MSDMLRITGMVSGMDTDTTVKKLIELEQIKVDKAEQEKQYLEWQKEDYREVANLLRGFQDEFLDVLNPLKNLRSESAFNMFSGTATVGGVNSSAVSIETSASSAISNFTIGSITSLATKDALVSGSEVFDNVTGLAMTAFDSTNFEATSNRTLSFTLDGVTKSIMLDSGLTSHEELASNLTVKLEEAFESVDINVHLNGSKLEFDIFKNNTFDPPLDPTIDPMVSYGDSVENGHTFTVGSTNSALLTTLGLESGQSNTLDASKTIGEIFNITVDDGDQEMIINGKSFAFSYTTTINDMMEEVNSSEAGVTMSFDSFNDRFTLESNLVGTDNAFKAGDIVDTSGLLDKMNLQGDVTHNQATDAVFEVNGVSTSRTSNSFAINGVTVTLNEESTEAISVGISADTSDTKDLIVDFVDKYNEMISEINDMVSERKNYDYKPLTDAQKEEMSDDDIEKWEEQARKGTLKGDQTLETLTSQMRIAMYESIEGVGISLHDIGIQTSSNYKEAGKLIINESKLDTALLERPNEVIELFTRESETEYTSYSSRSTRYSENGIANRINDIIKNNIRITRDDNGNKGYLIDKAGLETGSDATSEMAKKIQEMDAKIADLLEMLGDKEEKYYQDFARMESAMSSYSSQSAWLMSQFGG
jgi:flagellar hook-associated protein 2